MVFSRPPSLRASISNASNSKMLAAFRTPVAIFALLAAVPLLAQQQPAPQQPKPPNPFEQVPQAEEPKPLPPKPEPAKPETPGAANAGSAAQRHD